MVVYADGPGGVVSGKYIEIDESRISLYRNQGGFDIIGMLSEIRCVNRGLRELLNMRKGSGRTKIETPEQLEKTKKVCQDLQLDGLIIVGMSSRVLEGLACD